MKELIKGILYDFLYRLESGDCETVEEFIESYISISFDED